MTAALPDDRVQLRASPGGRDEAHQAIEAAIEVGLVDLQRAVRERLAASPDGAGAFQQALQSRRESGATRRLPRTAVLISPLVP
jgi:hypothetical protein